MSEIQLHFPDDLLFIWDYANKENFVKNEENEKKFNSYWSNLQKILSKKIELPPSMYDKCEKGKEVRDYREEEVRDYIVNILLSGPRPEKILTMGLLIRQLKKYRAQKNNPADFELDKILRTALLALEKENLIKRNSSERGCDISGTTLFTLYSDTSPENLEANYDDYLRNQKNIPSYTTKIRANDWESTQIITPKTAKELVLHLLEAFGSWTEKRNLLQAIKNHIPEQLNIITDSSLQTFSDDFYDDMTANIPLKNSQDYVYRQDIREVVFASGGLSRVIWSDICRISDRSFCLYYLPKELFFRKDVRQVDAGEPQRVSEHCQIFEKIFIDRFENFRQFSGGDIRGVQATRNVLNRIRKSLSGKCMEKGHSPSLYEVEEKKNNY